MRIVEFATNVYSKFYPVNMTTRLFIYFGIQLFVGFFRLKNMIVFSYMFNKPVKTIEVNILIGGLLGIECVTDILEYMEIKK